MMRHRLLPALLCLVACGSSFSSTTKTERSPDGGGMVDGGAAESGADARLESGPDAPAADAPKDVLEECGLVDGDSTCTTLPPPIGFANTCTGCARCTYNCSTCVGDVQCQGEMWVATSKCPGCP
jgi:hypothetical protein